MVFGNKVEDEGIEPYTMVLNSVICDKHIPIAVKMFIIYLANYDGPEGILIDSKRIMDELNINKNTLTNYIEKAKDLGYLETEKTGVNKYKFTLTGKVKANIKYTKSVKGTASKIVDVSTPYTKKRYRTKEDIALSKEIEIKLMEEAKYNEFLYPNNKDYTKKSS